jgi:uncharacterized membrane protein
MAVTRSVDGASVVRGALVEVFLVIPTAIIVAVATHGDPFTSSNLWVIETAVILVAPVAAGAVGARGHADSPLTHGALASAVGYAGTVLIGGVKRIFDGRGFYSASTVVLILLLLCITMTLGMTGGYLTFRREIRARQDDEA